MIETWDQITEIAKAMKDLPEWYERVIKPLQWELEYGEGSYEKFIFGGEPGL